MNYKILHDIPGRLRVSCQSVPDAVANAGAVGELLSMQDGIRSAVLSARTSNLLIVYSRAVPRDRVLSLLDVMGPSDWRGLGRGDRRAPPPLFEMTVSALARTALLTLVRRLLLPAPVRYATIVWSALPYIAKGFGSLLRGRLDIAVLDAAALTILALRRDFGAMRTILLLFAAADSLEVWTREQSRNSLADSLAIKIDAVWIRTERGDVKRLLADVRPGDLVVVRSGGVVPVDGVVAEGEAMVNQSVLTGESEAAHKSPGLSVFAGTVIDEGNIVVRTEKTADRTRLRGIIAFIEESEALKADIQSKAERLADAIVPYSLFLSLAALVATRSPIRAAAVLMVDYSCAIRMSTPLAILSAISEGIKRGVLIKGGKYIEELALADSLVLDKTGTLTMSRPRVARVIPFDGWDAREALRVSACIEEHFPHPVARAVVRKAEADDLRHREKHAEPEYILAHGVASRLDGRQVLIGSGHFIFEDMKVPLTPQVEREAGAEAGLGRSLIYMAYDGRVAGMLAIEDPIRDDAAGTLAGLSANGIGRITMLTGDGERTARTVSERLGIGSFHANLLPVGKAALIRECRRAGGRVMFVGDGVNDSPALSAADVGVSLKDGADIAKEVAGVVLIDGNLSGLLAARLLSVAALKRINRQFGFIVAVNTALMIMGLAGGISPRLAALLHNLGTVLVTANSIRRLLPDDGAGTVAGTETGIAAGGAGEAIGGDAAPDANIA